MRYEEKHTGKKRIEDLEKPENYNGELPSTAELEEALADETRRSRLRRTVKSTTFTLVVAAAAAILVAVLLLPILRIYGDSMQDTLKSGDIVVSVKSSDFERGDIAAFYYNNNILVKRVIAKSGDVVNIDSDGNVYVNGQKQNEPYLSSLAKGSVNIRLPYKVPEGKLFVMGDNRVVSVDSRDRAIGCVSSEQVVGKIVFRVWPLSRLGSVN